MLKYYFLVFFSLSSPFIIAAQMGIESSGLSNTCECSPPCASFGVDTECKHGRFRPREDCPCCKVCLSQEGEACDTITAPCDPKLSLTCSMKGICEETVKCKSDADCQEDRFCFKDTCSDPCPHLRPCLTSSLSGGICVTTNHQPRCECPKGTVQNPDSTSCMAIEEQNSSIPSLVSIPSHKACNVNGKPKEAGDSYYTHDCSQKCTCSDTGEELCEPLSCPTGLFPAGLSKNQKFCIEIRTIPLADECCVVLACSNNFQQNIHSPLNKGKIQSLFKEPRALTARKIPEGKQQIIDDSDYQMKLKELEALLNQNVTTLKNGTQLDEDDREPGFGFATPKIGLNNIDLTTLPEKVDKLTTTMHRPSDGIQLDKDGEKPGFKATTPQTGLNSVELTTFPEKVDMLTTMQGPSFGIQLDKDNGKPDFGATTLKTGLNSVELTTRPEKVDMLTTMQKPSFDIISLPNDIEVSTSDSLLFLDETVVPAEVGVISPQTELSGLKQQSNSTVNISLTTESEMLPVTERAFLTTALTESQLTEVPEQLHQFSESTELNLNETTTTEPTISTSDEPILSSVQPTTVTSITNAPEEKKAISSTMNIELSIEVLDDVTTTTPTPSSITEGDMLKEKKEKGMLMEIAEDGKQIHNVRLLSETHSNEFLREGKGIEGGFKPTVVAEKGLKPGKQQIKFPSKPELLQTKSSTHNSTTVTLPSNAGGVLHYKESRSEAEASKITVGEGEMEVLIKGLTPNTKYTLKWSGADGLTGKMEAKTQDGCLHNGQSYAVAAKWHEGCQTTCNCQAGGSSDCRPRCIFVAGAIKGDQCKEKPSPADPECCVEYDCEKIDNSVLDSSPSVGVDKNNKEGEPKLIVTSRTHSSVTVAWDDFRADKPDRGYVTEYREVPAVEINAQIPWMKKETLRGQPPPTMTIESLKPNTLYEVRVGIYSQTAETRLSAATETITVRTEPGCVYGNTSFPVGEFFQGCEERCSCAKDGSVKCSGRCTIPYFKKGSFANYPLCSEEQEEGDECCVLVMCAHSGSSGVEVSFTDYDQCANTVCGKNAECVSWASLTEASGNQDLPQPGSCRCKPGFSGDPTDHITGCVSDPTTEENHNKCVFRDTSYSPGDVFYDECAYKCICNNQREIECQPRCQFSANETLDETDSSCSFAADPDDDCCKIRVCNSSTSEDINSLQSTSLDFDGCVYRNKTYSKNEEFTFGCDSKCLCMGFSDVSCFPRCPPMKDVPAKEGVKCETLLDPEDECCNVTVCDNIAPEVMRANVTAGNFMILPENSTEVILLTDSMENETKTESTSEPDDFTVMKSMDESSNETLARNADNETSTEMTFSESSMSVNLSEDMDQNSSMITTTMDDLLFEESAMGKVETNSTLGEDNGMFLLDKEDANPMNETGVEDVIHSFNETSMNDTDTMTNASDVQMVDEMMKETSNETSVESVMADLDNETETTTILVEDILTEGRMFNGDSVANESMLIKRPRFDDIMIPPIEIKKIMPLDSSSVKVTLSVSRDVLASLVSQPPGNVIVSYSHDSLQWTNRTVSVNEIDIQEMDEIVFRVPDLEAHDAYQFKVYYKTIVSPTTKVSLSAAPFISNSAVVPHEAMCDFNDRHYKPGEEFYDGCDRYCMCSTDFTLHCRKIECPEKSGLDIMDPGCLEWEDDPDYVATPPRCCGQIPKCALHVSHLACDYMDQKFQHLDFIPKDLVPCDQRCQCLSGVLDCESFCNPVTANPPFHLPCKSHEAKIVTPNAYPCCKEWQCTNETDTDDSGPYLPEIPFPYPPLPSQPEISLVDVTDFTTTSVKILFTVAEIFSGLPAGIYLRYKTDDMKEPNSLKWESEVIHEDGEVIDNNSWEYVKKGLQPGTNYTMQLVLLTYLKKSESVSKKFTVSTLMEATTPLPRLDLDAELSVTEIQNTSAKISWKHFNDFELQYIDGIRVRFWPGNKKFPLEGPMLHREADNMILRDLDPDKRYTVDLFFIPHEGLASTTISNIKNVTFRTLPKPRDKYAFNITIQPGDVTKKGAQILYSGIPEPEGKFINVYRVVYTTDGDSQDSQKFKVPKTQKDGFILVTDLKPGVQYEVWLEAYLTNGSKKKSNVITIITAPGELPTPERSEIAEASGIGPSEGNYYSAFVALAVLVALACLVILGLIVLLKRRQNHAKAHINSSKSAYDNPSYKTSENPGYAMEMNGLKNTTNGASRSEEA